MTVNEMAMVSGCDRASITKRQKAWSLGKDLAFKDIFQLIPLNEAHAGKLDLQEQRALESFEKTRLMKMQADKLEGILADTSDLMAAENELFEMIAATIRTSELSEPRKQDIFSALRAVGRRFGEGAQ